MYEQMLSASITAVNGIPSGATAGVALRGASKKIDKQFADGEDEFVVAVKSTAGSDVMTATVAVWGYHADIGIWFRLKVLNAGSAIAETSSDAIQYAEVVDGLRHFDRVYVELTAIAGTATAVQFYLINRATRRY